MSNSKFQKYVMVKHDLFQHMKSSAIDEKNLSNDEVQMLKVLKDSKLSVNQRLKYYQQILFRTLSKRAEEISKKKSEDASRENKFEVERTFSKPKVFNDTQTQTNYVSKQKLNKAPTTEMEVQTDPEPVQSRTTPFQDISKRDIFSSSMIDDEPMEQNSDFEDAEENIYKDDKDELDLSREREDFLKYIQDNLSRKSDVNLKDLEFDHIDDANTSFINVIDKTNNERLSVPKSKTLFEKQQNEMKKVPAKRRGEVEVLQSAISLNPFPPSAFKRKTKTSTTTTGSGLQKRTKTWISYENYFL